jgi:hypothetical protein
MSNVFDRLQRQLNIQKRENGITALELADLPPNLRRIMRLMLRELVMKTDQIVTAVEAMPEANRMSRNEIETALAALVEQNWLLTSGEGEFLSYRVNLRRKAGSTLGQDIWATLNSRISQSPSEHPKETGEDHTNEA